MSKRSDAARFKRLKAQGKLSEFDLKKKADQTTYAKNRAKAQRVTRENQSKTDAQNKADKAARIKELQKKFPGQYDDAGNLMNIPEQKQAAKDKRAKEQKVIDEADEEGLTDLEKEQRRETPYGSNWFPDPDDFQFRDALKIMQQLNTVRTLPYKAIGGTVRNLLLINQGLNQPM